jgi:hypothetical protein
MVAFHLEVFPDLEEDITVVSHSLEAKAEEVIHLKNSDLEMEEECLGLASNLKRVNCSFFLNPVWF